MQFETIQSELARLRKEQSKMRQDEVFGGFSDEERSIYELKKSVFAN
jgi:ribosomal protein L29